MLFLPYAHNCLDRQRVDNAKRKQSALIQSEYPPFEGGSYVVGQKYLHRLDKWRALETAMQESIIGRTKADNVELEDAGKLFFGDDCRAWFMMQIAMIFGFVACYPVNLWLIKLGLKEQK